MNDRKDTESKQKKKQYSHSLKDMEHNGINVTLQENGKILLSKAVKGSGDNSDEMEYDEIEIPASLVIRLYVLLKATRRVKYVDADDMDWS